MPAPTLPDDDTIRASAWADEYALAMELALAAGAIQMERYERLEQVDHKGPRDVVTEVDHLCEALVIDRVRARYPADGFLAEESGRSTDEASRLWVVDPLDGTINYANGIPFFCVSIALVFDGRPVLGVVFDPTRGEMFGATDDGPPLLNGRAIEAADKEELGDLVVTLAVGGKRSSVGRRRAAIRRFRATRSMGSAALTLAYIACGRFDVYAQSQGLSSWDVAAAGLIAQRAGAAVTSLGGEAWFDIARPSKTWGLLAASRRHHAAILEMVADL